LIGLPARLVAVVGALIAGAVMSSGVAAHETRPVAATVATAPALVTPPNGLATPATVATAPTPAELGAEIASVADATATQWQAHELSSGALIDPVLGPLAGDYGVSMTGQAMVQAGLASGNEGLIADGVQSLVSEVRHPSGGSFELLGLSEAYAFDRVHLASNPNWLAASGRIARFLRRRGQSISDLGLCYTSSRCYTNLKLVSAVADLELLRTGLRGARHRALLGDPSALRARALDSIQMAVENAGGDAYRLGSVTFAGAGILSDPSENPLAYHALSTVMLGRAILILGSQAPADARSAFARTAEALVGLMAPDGDDTYIGRGQGQVWTVAAAIDALAIAAELTTDPLWRGRYLSAAAVALARLEALYPTSGSGFPLVPRLAGVAHPGGYRGVDHYANTVEYNGLALWELDDAAARIASAQPATAQPLPANGAGVFVDPSHARFAAVTHGTLWYAIHAIDSNTSDSRYGFGLVAAEIDTADGWEQALPERPLTSRRVPGGLAMVVGGRDLYPIGRRLSASADGTVRIVGGWSAGPKVIDRGTIWEYQPLASGDGVTLTFAARSGAAYAIQVWYQAGARLLRSRHGLSVSEPDGSTQTYSIGAPVHFSPGISAASAYAGNLRSTIMTVAPAAASRSISYTTLLSAPAADLGSTGPSGTTGASGASGPSGPSGPSGLSGLTGSSGASGSTGP
jgi:hypothetical protein